MAKLISALYHRYFTTHFLITLCKLLSAEHHQAICSKATVACLVFTQRVLVPIGLPQHIFYLSKKGKPLYLKQKNLVPNCPL